MSQNLDIVKRHLKYIQYAYDRLPDSKKRKYRRLGPYNRIKIKKIGVVSAFAAVYEIDFDGKWIAKVHSIDNQLKGIFAMNNDFINDTLRPFADIINQHQDIAKIAVSDSKIYMNNNTISVTFEKMLKGQTLQEKLAKLDIPAIHTIIDKTKKTLEVLHGITPKDTTITEPLKEIIKLNLQMIHQDLHSGNVFVEKDGGRPVIFDFDWSVFHHANYRFMYSKMKQVYDAYFKNIPIDTREFPTSCANVKGWYQINKTYSLFANENSKHKINMIKQADIAMMVNNILAIKCTTSPPSGFLERDTVANILTLGSGKYFLEGTVRQMSVDAIAPL